MSADDAWHKEWAIDRDPLAAAQARHLPSGLTMEINALSGYPHWVALWTHASRPLIARLQAQMGALETNEWLNSRGDDALQLWHALGFEGGGQPAIPAPACKLTSWRSNWTAAAHGDASRARPDLVHVSGLAIHFQHTAVGADATCAWAQLDAAGFEASNAALTASLDAANVRRLHQEAAILWMEQGYFENLTPLSSLPFGDDWRVHWQSEEGAPGEVWLRHASGLKLQPVEQVVAEDGETAWVLHTHPDWHAFEQRMRRTVGEKAWQRIETQAWSRCEELGLV